MGRRGEGGLGDTETLRHGDAENLPLRTRDSGLGTQRRAEGEDRGCDPPRRRAVALRYHPPEDLAPKVVAEGGGMVAEQIIELARQHRVPIREDPLLVQTLAKLDVGDAIPPDLYLVVAELFAWLYRLDREAGAAP